MLLLAALVIWFYQPALGLYFTGDDFVFLDRSRVASWSELPDLFSVERNQQGLDDQRHAWRPLSTNLYFALVQALFGPSSRAFHWANLGLLLASAFLLERLARRLGLRPAISAGLAFVYATCSISFDGQLWISVAQELWLANLVLLAAQLALPAAPGGPGAQARSAPAAALAAFGAALLCKETAVAFVGIAFAGELVLGGAGLRAAARRALPFAALGVAYLVWRLAAVGLPATGPYAPELGALLGPGLARYLVWSSESVFLARGARDLALLLVTGAGLCWLASPAQRRLCLFGALWFLIALAPVLILPAHAYPFYLVLPAAGWLLAAGALVEAAADRIRAPRLLGAAGAAALALFAWSSHGWLLERVETLGRRSDAMRQLLGEFQRQFPQVASGSRFYFLLPAGFPADALFKHSGAVLRVLTGNPSLQAHGIEPAAAGEPLLLRHGPGTVLEMGERGALRVLFEAPPAGPGPRATQ